MFKVEVYAYTSIPMTADSFDIVVDVIHNGMISSQISVHLITQITICFSSFSPMI